MTTGRAPAILVLLLLALLPTGARAAGWAAPSELAPVKVGTFSSPPSTAVAPDGTAFVSWVRRVGGGTPRLVVAVRTPGGNWSETEIANAANTTGYPGSPSPIAVAGDGTASVLYVDDASQLQVRSRPPGGTFGPAQRLNTSGTTVSSPAFAVNRSGDAIAAWDQSSGGNWTVACAFRSADGWGEANLLLPPYFSTVDSPKVALNNAGRSIVATGFGDGPGIAAAIRPAGGPFSGMASVQGDALLGSVAMSDAGAAVVGWSRTGNTAGVDYAGLKTTSAGGTTFGDEQQLSGTGGGVDVRVVAGQGERLQAVWLNRAQERVQYAGGTFAGGISGARPFLSPTGERAADLSFNVDAVGNRLVAWSNPTSFTLQAAYRAAGDADFDPVQTVPGSRDFIPDGGALAPTRDGDLLLAGRRGARGPGLSTGSGLQSAVYDITAPQLSGPIFPASVAAGANADFGLTASDRWSTPTVTWTFGDGTAATGAAVRHQYLSPGTYAWTATAADSAGNLARIGTDLPVTAPPAPAPVPGPGAPSGPVPLTAIDAQATLTWGAIRRGTTPILSLRLEGVRAGDRVGLLCRGKGCRKKTSRTVVLTAKSAKKGRYALTGAVGGLRLRTNATLTITVSRPGAVSRVIKYVMRAGKSPRKTTRCLVPGAKKTTACG